MEIESVELVYVTEDKSDVPNFVIHWKDMDATSQFLADAKDNRHYAEVAEWYKKQKKKPFKFEF